MSGPANRHRTALLSLARRCVWWKPPEETLKDAANFIAHVMTFGDWDDSRLLLSLYSADELREALRDAPAGVFDGQSWHYWHHVLGIWDVPPRPVRRLPGVEPSTPTSKREWAREFHREDLG